MRDERGRHFKVHTKIELSKGEPRFLPRSVFGRAKSLSLYALGLGAIFAVPVEVESFDIDVGWTLIITLASLGVAVMLFALGWWIANSELYERAARSMRHGMRCPQCWYDLSSLTPEEDGCVVCPECGAAWRVGDAEVRLDG